VTSLGACEAASFSAGRERRGGWLGRCLSCWPLLTGGLAAANGGCGSSSLPRRLCWEEEEDALILLSNQVWLRRGLLLSLLGGMGSGREAQEVLCLPLQKVETLAREAYGASGVMCSHFWLANG